MARHLHGNNEIFLAANTSIEDHFELLSWPLMLAHMKPLMFNSDRYVDAATMRKVGAFTLNIADPNKVTDPDAYKFTVNFQLGGSEVTATAIDDQTNLEVQTTVILVAE